MLRTQIYHFHTRHSHPSHPCHPIPSSLFHCICTIHVTRHRTQSFTLEPFTCHHHHPVIISLLFRSSQCQTNASHPQAQSITFHNQSYILYNVFTSTLYVSLFITPWVLIPQDWLIFTHTKQLALTTLTTISIEDEHTPDAQTISHPFSVAAAAALAALVQRQHVGLSICKRTSGIHFVSHRFAPRHYSQQKRH